MDKAMIELLNILHFIEIDTRDLSHLIKNNDMVLLNKNLYTVLRHFDYDFNLFERVYLTEKGIVFPIDVLLRKLAQKYHFNEEEDILLSSTVEALEWEAKDVKDIKKIEIRDIVLDISDCDKKIKNTYRKRQIADLRLIRTIVLNKDMLSLCSNHVIEKDKFCLYIAYLIKEKASKYLLDGNEVLYNGCIKYLNGYIELNKNLLEQDYSFEVEVDYLTKVKYSIREIEKFFKEMPEFGSLSDGNNKINS